MPTEPPFPDANNPEGFYLIKRETRDEIGNRKSNNKAFDYFDEKDIGVVQSTALIQPLNSAEFTPTPGAERETMTKGLNSANFDGLEAQSLQFSWGSIGLVAGMTPIDINWAYDNSSTAAILNSEKTFGQQMANYFNGNATDGSNTNTFFDDIENISFSDLIANTSFPANFAKGQFVNQLKTLFGQAIPEINDTNDLSVIIQIFSDIASGQKSFSLAVGQVTSLTNIATENIIDSINKMYGSSFSDQDAVLQDSTRFIQNFFDASQKFDLLKKDLELIIGPAFSSETFWPEFQKFVLGSDVYDSLSQSEINDFKINLISGFLKNQNDISGLFETISTGLSFTGLMDTPTGFESGKFLVANETGLEWTDIEDPVLSFTGLSDTPTGYDDGKILQSTTTGLAWVNMPVSGGGGGVDSVNNIFDLPDNPTNGQLITVGCDLFIGCSGQWVKVGEDSAPPAEGVPDCVFNLDELTQYIAYKDSFISQNTSNSFMNAFNSDIDPFVIDVCTYPSSNLPEEELNVVKIDESTFKWGIFAQAQTINLSAIEHIDPQGAECTFKNWDSSTNLAFADSQSKNTSLFVDQDCSITGYFECFLPPKSISSDQLQFNVQATNSNTTIEKSQKNRSINNINGVLSDNTQQLFNTNTLNFQGSSRLEVGDIGDFTFLHDGSSDYTVEFWTRVENLAPEIDIGSNNSGSVGTQLGYVQGSPLNLFDSSNSTHYSIRNVKSLAGFSVQLRVNFTRPIENIDQIKWTFQVTECCGGRTLSIKRASDQQWILGVAGGSGSQKRTDTRNGPFPPFDAIRMAYGGRSSAPRQFYNFNVDFLANALDPNLPTEELNLTSIIDPFVSTSYNQTVPGLNVYSAGGTIKALMYNGSSTYNYSTQNSLIENQWSHVAVTFKDGKFYSHIDGIFQGELSNPIASPSQATQQQKLLIGAAHNVPGNSIRHLKGRMQDIRVSKTAIYSNQGNFKPPTSLF